MLRRGARPGLESDEDLSWVYGAAIRAASDHDTAARATVAAMSASRRDGKGRGDLMVAAVRSALADSPSEPLAGLPSDEREAIGLVRILGLDVDEVATVLRREPREVKALVRSGLTRLVAVR